MQWFFVYAPRREMRTTQLGEPAGCKPPTPKDHPTARQIPSMATQPTSRISKKLNILNLLTKELTTALTLAMPPLANLHLKTPDAYAQHRQ